MSLPQKPRGEALVLTAKKAQPPDLVVLDFSLSFLDGLSVGQAASRNDADSQKWHLFRR